MGMNKLRKYKTIQLSLYTLFAVIVLYLIVFQSDIYRLMASNPDFRLVSVIIWILFIMAFAFIFIDISLYSAQDNQAKVLDIAAYSDTMVKMANRRGIDDVIRRYSDAELPDDICCVMFILSSLWDANDFAGREAGDRQLRNFSTMLNLASINKCFVGRNGGNVFLAIFEGKQKIEVNDFLDRVGNLVKNYDEDKDNIPIRYQYGVAYNSDERAKSINILIALSNERAKVGKEVIKNSRRPVKSKRK